MVNVNLCNRSDYQHITVYCGMRTVIPFSPLGVTKWQKNVILSFLFPLAHNLILFMSKADAIS